MTTLEGVTFWVDEGVTFWVDEAVGVTAADGVDSVDGEVGFEAADRADVDFDADDVVLVVEVPVPEGSGSPPEQAAISGSTARANDALKVRFTS